MTRTVGDVARLARISVRALHHYDAIGLLSPSARSEGGYRLYDDADLGRLQRILGYRELGFDLAAIRELLEDGDELTHLRRQAALLDRRLARLGAMRAALRTTMEARTMGVTLSPEETLEVFGDDDPTGYAEEAEARWGDTDAWRQSRARTRRYDKDDWVRIKAAGDAIEARFATAFAAGEPATAERAMDVAEAHRAHIDGTFYDCSHAMHVSLAELFVTDPRFEDHYERRAEGLAAYVADAIRANAARQAGP